MAAMWAHLFRDPAPATLIKQRAPRVGRWVERMSTTEPYISEYRRPADASAELFADDSVPDTLVAMLRYVAEEYLAEITAHVDVRQPVVRRTPRSRSRHQRPEAATRSTAGHRRGRIHVAGHLDHAPA